MKENADTSWRGVATMIEPSTGAFVGIVGYHHEVAVDPPANARRITVRTTTEIGPGDVTKEVMKLPEATTDVDLDGAYSCEHPKGSLLASKLLNAAGVAGGDSAAAGLVIEHCLGPTDDERLRVLLAYDARTRELMAVLYLRESKGEPDDAARRADAARVKPPATLQALEGNWTGDGTMRFYRGESARTSIFKIRLEYDLDTKTNFFNRVMSLTPFGKKEPINISSRGTALTDDRSGSVRVRFYNEAAAPVFHLLPNGCYVMAPLVLPPDKCLDGSPSTYTTEFGAMLEPGDAVGWRSFQEGLDKMAADSSKADGERLLRNQRIYEGGQLASGTHSYTSDASA